MGAVLEGTKSRARRRNFGKNHAYYLEMPDGSEVKLDGVTSLIGDGLPKPALINWAGNVTAEYAVDHWAELTDLAPSARLKKLKDAKYADRDLAAAKGTLVHDLAEKILLGQEVEVPDEVAGHVDSAVRFLDEFKVVPIVTETTVWNEKGFYGGTLDMIFRSGLPKYAGRVILGDWKTSRSGIYDEAALQLSAYGHGEFFIGEDGLDHPLAELEVTDHWGVWIRSDGYDVYPLDRSEQVFRTFQYIASVARRARAMKETPLKFEALERPVAS
jgi:hypothetical protein